MADFFSQIHKRAFPEMLTKLALAKKPTALNIFAHLIACSNYLGISVVSQKALQKAVHAKTRQTIYKNTKFLAEHHYLMVSKVGNQNVYIMNPNLIWQSGRNYGKRVLRQHKLIFPANVVITKDDDRGLFENYKEFIKRNPPTHVDLDKVAQNRKGTHHGKANHETGEIINHHNATTGEATKMIRAVAKLFRSYGLSDGTLSNKLKRGIRKLVNGRNYHHLSCNYVDFEMAVETMFYALSVPPKLLKLWGNRPIQHDSSYFLSLVMNYDIDFNDSSSIHGNDTITTINLMKHSTTSAYGYWKSMSSTYSYLLRNGLINEDGSMTGKGKKQNKQGKMIARKSRKETKKEQKDSDNERAKELEEDDKNNPDMIRKRRAEYREKALRKANEK